MGPIRAVIIMELGNKSLHLEGWEICGVMKLVIMVMSRVGGLSVQSSDAVLKIVWMGTESGGAGKEALLITL